MSILGDMWNKLTGHAAATATTPEDTHPTTPAGTSSDAAATPAANPTPLTADAMLTKMAAANPGHDNWRTSITDLLKLLGMDSSIQARSDLAEELGVRNYSGTAEQNEALHAAVMQRFQQQEAADKPIT